jgi:uracil-DNA glycosylase
MPTNRFTHHLETLFACRACPNVIGEPVTGAVRGAKLMLVGQAPGPREMADSRPFAYTAGQRLFCWFARIGVSEEAFREKVYTGAVIRCFPGRNPKGGGDRVPTPQEIQNCGAHLDREIRLLSPKLVIAVGTLAARQFLEESSLDRVVGRSHRATRAGKSFDLVVLPHPSGRSTWLNDPGHERLLDKSLKLIGRHPAFRATFSRIWYPLSVIRCPENG